MVIIPYIMFSMGCYLLLLGFAGNYSVLFWGLVFMWLGAENAGLDAEIKRLRSMLQARMEEQ